MTYKLKLFCAFTIVYLVWGSTFLAIKFAVDTLPPFLMMAVRFGVAGAILYAFTAARGAAKPSRGQVWSCSWTGFLLVVMGTGVIGWVEERLPSGLCALVLAATPIWMVVLEAFQPQGLRPGRDGVIGLAMGVGGMLLLISPGDLSGANLDGLGLIVLVISSACWAYGSIAARHADLPKNTLQSTGLQMMIGALMLIAIALVQGEFAHLDPASLSAKSVWSLVYLIVMGSLMVFPAYNWLMKNVNPNMVATHAYINPIVALALGYFFANEAITTKTVLAAIIILCSVLFISSDKPKKRKPKMIKSMTPNLGAS